MEKEAEEKQTRKRGGKLFPVLCFNDALILAKGINEHGTGKQMRRLTLFDKLQKSPTSGPSRLLVTISNRYGLTTGSYSSEYLTITDSAKIILEETTSEFERRQKSFELSIQQQDILNQVYERLKGKKLPAPDVLRDELAQIGLPKSDLDTASEIFLQNSRDLGLIKEISGKETIIPIEQVLEEFPHVESQKMDESEIKIQSPSKPVIVDKPKVRFEPKIQINIEIHIAPDTPDEKIKLIFENMKTCILDNE